MFARRRSINCGADYRKSRRADFQLEESAAAHGAALGGQVRIGGRAPVTGNISGLALLEASISIDLMAIHDASAVGAGRSAECRPWPTASALSSTVVPYYRGGSGRAGGNGSASSMLPPFARHLLK